MSSNKQNINLARPAVESIRRASAVLCQHTGQNVRAVTDILPARVTAVPPRDTSKTITRCQNGMQQATSCYMPHVIQIFQFINALTPATHKFKTIPIKQAVILYISGMFTHYKAKCNTKMTVNHKYIFQLVLQGQKLIHFVSGEGLKRY